MIFFTETKQGIQKAIDYINQLPEGKYEIEIEKVKSKRSSQQNRYYWNYLRIISDDTGDDINNLHEFFKRKCLPPKFVMVLGREVKLPATTTKLSKSEFSFYIQAIEELTEITAPNYD